MEVDLIMRRRRARLRKLVQRHSCNVKNFRKKVLGILDKAKGMMRSAEKEVRKPRERRGDGV